MPRHPVADADATLTCTHCGRVSPRRMQICPGCLALLRPVPEVVEDVLAHALAAGHHLHRPAWREPFAGGPDCTVERLVAHGGLVICGGDGLIEADVRGYDHRAIPPLLLVGTGHGCQPRNEAARRCRTFTRAARTALPSRSTDLELVPRLRTPTGVRLTDRNVGDVHTRDGAPTGVRLTKPAPPRRVRRCVARVRTRAGATFRTRHTRALTAGATTTSLRSSRGRTSREPTWGQR